MTEHTKKISASTSAAMFATSRGFGGNVALSSDCGQHRAIGAITAENVHSVTRLDRHIVKRSRRHFSSVDG